MLTHKKGAERQQQTIDIPAWGGEPMDLTRAGRKEQNKSVSQGIQGATSPPGGDKVNGEAREKVRKHTTAYTERSGEAPA